MSKRMTDEIVQWVASRNLGAVRAKKVTIEAQRSPSLFEALENAEWQIVEASNKDRDAATAALAREANDLSRAANDEGKRTRNIALAALVIAALSLLLQFYAMPQP